MFAVTKIFVSISTLLRPTNASTNQTDIQFNRMTSLKASRGDTFFHSKNMQFRLKAIKWENDNLFHFLPQFAHLRQRSSIKCCLINLQIHVRNSRSVYANSERVKIVALVNSSISFCRCVPISTWHANNALHFLFNFINNKMLHRQRNAIRHHFRIMLQAQDCRSHEVSTETLKKR